LPPPITRKTKSGAVSPTSAVRASWSAAPARTACGVASAAKAVSDSAQARSPGPGRRVKRHEWCMRPSIPRTRLLATRCRAAIAPSRDLAEPVTPTRAAPLARCQSALRAHWSRGSPWCSGAASADLVKVAQRYGGVNARRSLGMQDVSQIRAGLHRTRRSAVFVAVRRHFCSSALEK
jgi:hypothetical protein